MMGRGASRFGKRDSVRCTGFALTDYVRIYPLSSFLLLDNRGNLR